jgi:hypothetical protein
LSVGGALYQKKNLKSTSRIFSEYDKTTTESFNSKTESEVTKNNSEDTASEDEETNSSAEVTKSEIDKNVSKSDTESFMLFEKKTHFARLAIKTLQKIAI